MYKYTISLVEEHVKHRNKINEKACKFVRSVLNLTLIDN